MRNVFWIGLFLIVTSLYGQVAAAETFQYDSHGRRDPFVPSDELNWDSGGMGLSDMNLEGIIIDESGSYAIINSQIIEKGDEYGGFLVLEIEPNRVIIAKDEANIFQLILRTDQELLEKLYGDKVPTEGGDELSEKLAEENE